MLTDPVLGIPSAFSQQPNQSANPKAAVDPGKTTTTPPNGNGSTGGTETTRSGATSGTTTQTTQNVQPTQSNTNNSAQGRSATVPRDPEVSRAVVESQMLAEQAAVALAREAAASVQDPLQTETLIARISETPQTQSLIAEQSEAKEDDAKTAQAKDAYEETQNINRLKENASPTGLRAEV